MVTTLYRSSTLRLRLPKPSRGSVGQRANTEHEKEEGHTMARIIQTDVELRIGRLLGGSEDRGSWRLEVIDRRSGTHVMEARFDNDTFADLMSTRGAKCEAEFRGVEHVGRYQHCLQLLVEDSGSRSLTDEERNKRQAARALRRWQTGGAEVMFDGTDGWEYSHTIGGGGGNPKRKAIFYRYSDVEEVAP